MRLAATLTRHPDCRAFPSRSTRYSWSRLFDEPMQDGGEHVAAVPKNVHDAPEWPLATEAMILMSEQGYVRPD